MCYKMECDLFLKRKSLVSLQSKFHQVCAFYGIEIMWNCYHVELSVTEVAPGIHAGLCLWLCALGKVIVLHDSDLSNMVNHQNVVKHV